MNDSLRLFPENPSRPDPQGKDSFPAYCNLCGHNGFALVYKGNLDLEHLDRFAQYSQYGDIFRCTNCGLVVQKLEHDIETICDRLRQEKYMDEPIGPLSLKEKYAHFDMLIRYIRHISNLNGAIVLDAGANAGIFLNRIKPLAGELHGIEPSAEAAAVARGEFSIEMQNVVISKAQLPDGYFDIITMWDVIEHLYDPCGDLSFLRSKLKPGGKIFISTHDVDGLFARITGRRYPMLMYQHFFHFSKRTIKMALEKNGFRVLGFKSHNKSWSFAYLYYLVEKLWPNSSFTRAFQAVMTPFMKIPWLCSRRIVVPVRNFFIVAAERPE